MKKIIELKGREKLKVVFDENHVEFQNISDPKKNCYNFVYRFEKSETE